MYIILYIKPYMNVVTISDFRTNLPGLISQISEKLERLVITVSGKPKAVVLSLEELESLEETAEILATPGALKAIRNSLKEVRRGRYITLEKLKGKYKL